MAKQFNWPTSIERRYAVELRKVAKIVAGIMRSHINGAELNNPEQMAESLKRYSEALGPWADRLAQEMLRLVSQANYRSFTAASNALGKDLRSMLAETAMGGVAKLLQDRQVELIKSLPLDAGRRAQELAQSAAMGGRRASEVAQELARTEQVTASRATLIARTEIAKANAAITQARAEFVGATHYIWETAEDGDVRPSHAEMEGQIFRFDQPPTLSDGMRGNPGEFPNCRCFAVPIINK